MVDQIMKICSSLIHVHQVLAEQLKLVKAIKTQKAAGVVAMNHSLDKINQELIT